MLRKIVVGSILVVVAAPLISSFLGKRSETKCLRSSLMDVVRADKGPNEYGGRSGYFTNLGCGADRTKFVFTDINLDT